VGEGVWPGGGGGTDVEVNIQPTPIETRAWPLEQITLQIRSVLSKHESLNPDSSVTIVANGW
jgi:hypothetical protein